MEKAGGHYVQGKAVFAFDKGIDCQAVLNTLLAGEVINVKQQYQFFATQKTEAKRACEAAGPLVGKRVLEPSAGDGALADVAREMGAKEIVTVEMWAVNAQKLRDKGYQVHEKDFLTLSPAELGLFDAIVANPPFTKNQDIKHVMHMLNFLKPGGSLSVIMSPGWQEGRQKTHQAFKEFLASQDVAIEPIAAGAFKGSGTSIPTVQLVISNYRPPIMDDELGEDEFYAMAM